MTRPDDDVPTHAKHRVPDGSEVHAVDREQLRAALTKPPRPWLVVRQYSHLADLPVCTHRWEWTADLCAYRKTRGHPDETGGHYAVRREVSR